MELVRLSRHRDQSPGREDSCHDVVDLDDNGYRKIKSIGWRLDPHTEGAAYGRHQGEIEDSNDAAVEEDDDEDYDKDDDDDDDEDDDDAVWVLLFKYLSLV